MTRNDTIARITALLNIDPISLQGAQVIQALHEHLAVSPNMPTLVDMTEGEVIDLGFNAKQHALNAVLKDFRERIDWTQGLPSPINRTADGAAAVPVTYVYKAAIHRMHRDEFAF